MKRITALLVRERARKKNSGATSLQRCLHHALKGFHPVIFQAKTQGIGVSFSGAEWKSECVSQVVAVEG